MQKQGIDALKRMAAAAKSRLRNKVRENDSRMFYKNNGFKVLFGEGVEIKSKIITEEDEKFYKKVKDMLDENFDVANPITRLIDYKVYNKLEDSRLKERYLFDVISKYQKYRTRYELEKMQQII